MKVSRIYHIDLQIIKRVLFQVTGANVPAKKMMKVMIELKFNVINRRYKISLSPTSKRIEHYSWFLA